MLALFEDPIFESLWSDDLDVVALAPPSDDPIRPTGDEIESASRQLAIFLDLVAYRASDSEAFLFDRSYDALLDDAQRGLRDALGALRDAAAGAPDSAGWNRVREFLREYGDPDSDE